jgi:hypothetical protein
MVLAYDALPLLDTLPLQDDLREPLAMFDLVVNCLFLWDVWMNFHTAYLSELG